ncbi:MULTISPECIES: hypothetical protein [Pacificimonas]|uniref:Uncharacterized protein n=1 Tax=Pacificimonas aurantium TaxID=1250540 RepID=A0ABS7WG70_9SPHN|nr:MULTISPECIES: hypothetical protein [Pacificimonas]MBZ6377393.1 hypothetical protein [Pacificimonas aurantium]
MLEWVGRRIESWFDASFDAAVYGTAAKRAADRRQDVQSVMDRTGIARDPALKGILERYR